MVIANQCSVQLQADAIFATGRYHDDAWDWLRDVVLAALLIGVLSIPGLAQSQNQAAVLRGEGAFLQGAGSYNLNTASAASVNVDTVIRWKQDLRRIEAERRDLHARNEAGKKLRIEEVRKRQQIREYKLRVDPDATDIHTGEALNVLLYDLTDPDITSAMWSAKIVDLPRSISVKDLVFRFTPLSGSSDTSKALSKGVIALSRLDTTGDKWPTMLKQKEVARERDAYEAAYAKLRGQLLDDNLKLQTLTDLDDALKALKKQVEKEIPKDRGFRDEALRFVDDLKNATRFFDARTVDYAREILADTQEQDARTVAELVSFMLKYRLQFASAERSPATRPLYGQLYEAMQKQARKLDIKPPEPPELTVEKPVPTSELDRIATGKWIRLVDARTELPDPQRMAFQNGILELNDTRLEFPRINARDVIIRAQVRRISGLANMGVHGEKVAEYRGIFCGADALGVALCRIGISRNPWKELTGANIGLKIENDGFVEMAFAAIGDVLTLYIDGKAAVSVRNNELTAGYISVGVFQGRVHFKNVEYQILDPQPSGKHK